MPGSDRSALQEAVDAIFDDFLREVASTEDLRRERRKPKVCAVLDGFSDEHVLSEIRRRQDIETGPLSEAVDAIFDDFLAGVVTLEDLRYERRKAKVAAVLEAFSDEEVFNEVRRRTGCDAPESEAGVTDTSSSTVAGSAPSAVGSVVVERVIERQILVTRCQFCGELTPVDLKTCAGCGAPYR